MKILIILICLFSLSCSNIFKKDNAKDFIKTLNHFQYSLFADLDTIDVLFQMQLSENHTLVKKIRTFIIQHEKEIKKYQNYILGRYEVGSIELNNYVEEFISTEDDMAELWGKKHGEIVKELEGKNLYYIWKLMKINPITYINTIITQYRIRVNLDKFTKFTKSLFIAQPLWETERLDKRYWNIKIDYYHEAFVFKYDSENDEIISFKKYIRK